MKQIIALCKRSNTGKTNTLNYLIGLLDKSQEADIITAPTGDRRVVISYNNKKIAITTCGDNGEELNKNIKFFEENGCDILVTATRSKGKTKEIISNYAQKIKANIIWIEKNIAQRLTDRINQTQAEDIQAVINNLS